MTAASLKKALNWVSLSLLCLFTFCAVPSMADVLSVRARGSYGEKQIDLPPGQAGKIAIHITSAGEPVGGYEVSLFRDSDSERLGTKVSNDHGIVIFDELSANSYTAILLRSELMIQETTIAIGDFILESYNPQIEEEVEIVEEEVKEEMSK